MDEVHAHAALLAWRLIEHPNGIVCVCARVCEINIPAVRIKACVAVYRLTKRKMHAHTFWTMVFLHKQTFKYM